MYWWANIYIGGKNRASGCPQENLNENWIHEVSEMGYGLLPTWVGLQPPCSNYEHRFSSDTATAKEQGRSNADYAIQKMNELGMKVISPPSPDTLYSIVYFDLEGYAENVTTACRDATKAFMNGWVNQLNSFDWKAGVYGSGCGSFLDDFWDITNRPQNVWIATWNDNPSVYAVSCVPDAHWDSSRFHQYKDEVTETHNGTTLTIDKNCAKGKVEGDGTYYGENTDCA